GFAGELAVLLDCRGSAPCRQDGERDDRCEFDSHYILLPIAKSGGPDHAGRTASSELLVAMSATGAGASFHCPAAFPRGRRARSRARGERGLSSECLGDSSPKESRDGFRFRDDRVARERERFERSLGGGFVASTARIGDDHRNESEIRRVSSGR